MPKRSLQAGAMPAQKKPKRLNAKSALNRGELLASVTYKGLQVTLELQAPYNDASKYRTINRTLFNIYQITPAFQAIFELPSQGSRAPTLRLKEGHGYADSNEILEALKAFACPQKPLKIKEALNEGSLLASVTFDGLQVTLCVQEPYNQASSYKKINQAFYDLYKYSMGFQEKFEQPKIDSHILTLQLKEDHGYANSNEILEALKAFASPLKPLMIKAALREDTLLMGVTLEGLQATLHLQAPYNQACNYQKINQALYEIYRTTPSFQATFEQPAIVKEKPILRLKEGHGYPDGDAIWVALKSFASPRKLLNVKAALSEGKLLVGVTLEGLHATLHLQAPYNEASNYNVINRKLYDLYQISPDFQSKFENPKQGAQAPFLRLKMGHGYANGYAIKDALRMFASSQKRLKVKAALREGRLLAGVTLKGLLVTVHIQAVYNQASNYIAINQALYYLYKVSKGFQAKFEQPRRENQVPILRLKEGHGYTDDNAIIAALIEFAGCKANNASSCQENEINDAEQSSNVLLMESFPQQADKLHLPPSDSDPLTRLYDLFSSTGYEQDIESFSSTTPFVTPHFNSMAANNSRQEFEEFPDIYQVDIRKSPTRG
jgi:hypothetical protein